MDYAIRHVFDAVTGEVLDAEVLFKRTEMAHLFRKNYHTTDQQLRCVECHKAATVGTSPKGRVHFRHFPNTGDCILKDDWTPFERKQIEAFHASRESKRHKTLKANVGDYLRSVDGVDPSSIIIDDAYINDGRERRRPDVYCTFNEQKIAFEIQISRLPAKYIFKRHEFYKRNQIFLIWVLVGFDKNGQSQTARDIKYLNKHQNYFFFFENGQKKSFVVQFKRAFIKHNELQHVWEHEFVTLSQLTYDSEDYQVFYRSLSDEDKKASGELVEPTISLFRNFYISDDHRMKKELEEDLTSLSPELLRIVNERIGGVNDSNLYFKSLTGKGKPHFVIYMLESSFFEKNLNTKNSSGHSILQFTIENNQLSIKNRIIQLFFSNGYKLTPEDIEFLKTYRSYPSESKGEREQRLARILAYNELGEDWLIKLYDRCEGAVLTMVSAKKNDIIGFNLPNWLSVANNAIHNYTSFWQSIETVFRHYGVMMLIENADEKETFKKKRLQIQNNTTRTHESSPVIMRLFPEVFGQTNSNSDWCHHLDSLKQ